MLPCKWPRKGKPVLIAHQPEHHRELPGAYPSRYIRAQLNPLHDSHSVSGYSKIASGSEAEHVAPNQRKYNYLVSYHSALGREPSNESPTTWQIGTKSDKNRLATLSTKSSSRDAFGFRYSRNRLDLWQTFTMSSNEKSETPSFS
jgi:hypothetical protein